MILVLVPLVCLVAAGMASFVRAVRLSMLDAMELASKLDTPHPSSARDWPELRVDAVVVDPEIPRRLLVLVRWPARPDPRSLLVLETADETERAERLLMQWRDAGAAVSPTRRGDMYLVLRRRRSPELLRARLVGESRAA